MSTPRVSAGEVLSARAKDRHIGPTDYDIGIAGKLLDGTMTYGECKWWRELVGENVLDEIIARASLTDYGRDNPERQFVL